MSIRQDDDEASLDREPWHYDAIEGRPQWSKEMARQRVIQRQKENDDARRKAQGRSGESHATN